MKLIFDNMDAFAELENYKEEEMYLRIRTMTKVDSPGAKYTEPYYKWKKSKGKMGWDGKVEIIKKNRLFPTGLVPAFVKLLWENEKIVPTLEDRRSVSPIDFKDLKMKLRGYQFEALEKGATNSYQSMWWPRGIFEQATGAGKTELAVSLYQVINRPTLFVVHLKSLAAQTIERFKKYGIDCGRLFDGAEEISPNINVATIQTLNKHKDMPLVHQMLQNVEQVFFDEAHLIAASASKGNWFVDISGRMPKAFFRWGLTATPFRKDEYSNLLLAGATGSILHSIKTKELIDQGYLAAAIVKILTVPAIHKCPKKWPECYDHGILLNKARTDMVVDQILANLKPMFVFTMREAHVSIIENAAKIRGLKVQALTGKNSLEERSKALEKLKSGVLDAIVCTTIFDEGIDFESLNTVIMAGGGKSQIKTMQRLGRGIRKFGSKVLTIVDFHDTSAPKLKEHSKIREATYKEQGFEIDV